MQRAGFSLPVTDSDVITVTYENAFQLMSDLRGMGETEATFARPKQFTRRELFLQAANLYQERYGAIDGRISATFEIIYMHGWSPHESQQKALRPGSAKTRLADALGSKESSASEKGRPS